MEWIKLPNCPRCGWSISSLIISCGKIEGYFCSNCGAKLDINSRSVCSDCGSKLYYIVSDNHVYQLCDECKTIKKFKVESSQEEKLDGDRMVCSQCGSKLFYEIIGRGVYLLCDECKTIKKFDPKPPEKKEEVKEEKKRKMKIVVNKKRKKPEVLDVVETEYEKHYLIIHDRKNKKYGLVCLYTGEVVEWADDLSAFELQKAVNLNFDDPVHEVIVNTYSKENVTIYIDACGRTGNEKEADRD